MESKSYWTKRRKIRKNVQSHIEFIAQETAAGRVSESDAEISDPDVQYDLCSVHESAHEDTLQSSHSSRVWWLTFFGTQCTLPWGPEDFELPNLVQFD